MVGQVHSIFWERHGISTKEKKITISWDELLEDEAEEHSWQARLAGIPIKYEIRMRVTVKNLAGLKGNVSKTKPFRVEVRPYNC